MTERSIKLDNPTFETIEEAALVFEALINTAIKWKMISVVDYREAMGEVWAYEENALGWGESDIDKFKLGYDGEYYVIELPPVVEL